MNNKKGMIFILLAIIIIVCIFLFVLNNENKIKEYSNDDIELVYDSTWSLVDKKELSLKHKKSESTFKVVIKDLESNYYDTSLKDMIKDIVYDIQKQNKGFILINTEENVSDKYEGYSYLYENEKNEEQVLVNIYKKDNKVVIVYYSASNEYYDIVLDSVDAMLKSLKIKSGV